MAKSSSIKWINGSVLSGLQLEKSKELAEIYSWSLVSSMTSHNYGIVDLSISLLGLQDKKFRIDRLVAIFPNGTCIHVDNDIRNQSIFLDLEPILGKFSKATTLYAILGKSEESSELVGFGEEESLILIRHPTVQLSLQSSKNSIALGSLFTNPMGSLEFNLNSSTLLKVPNNHKLFKRVKSIILHLQGMSLLLQKQTDDLGELGNLRFKSYSKAIAILTGLLSESHPHRIHYMLSNTIAELGWIFSMCFVPRVYQHNNSLSGIVKMINRLDNLMDKKQVIIIEPEVEGEYMAFNLSNNKYNNLYLVISPNNIKSQQWIESTNIASLSTYQMVFARRFKGIGRINYKTDNQNNLWVKLCIEDNDKYFIEGEKIYVRRPKIDLTESESISCHMLLEQ